MEGELQVELAVKKQKMERELEAKKQNMERELEVELAAKKQKMQRELEVEQEMERKFLAEFESVDLPTQFHISPNNPSYIKLQKEFGLYIGRPKEEIHFYQRKAVTEEWETLKTETTSGNCVYILGAPGAGKTVSAFVFAVNSTQNFMWFYIYGEYVSVLLRENGSFCHYQFQDPLKQAQILLNSKSGSFNVFFDGFRNKELEKNFADQIFRVWFKKKNFNLIVVSSVGSRPKAKPHVDEINLIKEVYLSSWTKQEYLDALSIPEFQKAVSEKWIFPENKSLDVVPDLNDPKSNSDNKIKYSSYFERKYYYAGGSCRYMFGKTVDQTCSDIERALESYKEDNVESSVNRLQQLFIVNRKRVWLVVSSFAAVCIAQLSNKKGPIELLMNSFSGRSLLSPPLKGMLFEGFVIMNLLGSDGICISEDDKDPETWVTWKAKIMESSDFIGPIEFLSTGVFSVWIKPKSWKQGVS